MIELTAGTAVGGNISIWIPRPSTEYVQNGLVAMWDGIDNAGVGVHSMYPTAWKNLGSLGSTYDFTTFKESSWSNNAFMINSLTGYACCDNMIPRSSIITMEVCFQVVQSTNVTTDNNRIRMFMFGDRIASGNYQMTRRMVAWDVYSGKRGWMFATGQGLPSGQTGTSVPLGYHSFSVVYPTASDTNYNTGAKPVRVVKNGSQWSISSWLNEGDAVMQKQFIGCPLTTGGNSLNCGISGKVFCVRLYSRQLSLTEQQSNHALDVQRFNIPA